MKINHHERPGALAKDNGRRLRETICDTATNSFLPIFSYPEIPGSTARSFEPLFDRRVFLGAIASAPLVFVCRAPKPRRTNRDHMTAMFARRV